MFMSLSVDLISQFAKITNDKQPTVKETVMYGTAVKYNNEMYVRLDGSDMLTPIDTTVDVKSTEEIPSIGIKDGERVSVTLRNHTAVATGNASSPAARIDTVNELSGKVNIVNSSIDIYNSSFQIVNGVVTGLKGVTVDWITTESLEASSAYIDNLTSNSITAEDIKTTYLKAKNIETEYAKIGDLTALTGRIDKLETGNLTTDTLDARYASIDFANINSAEINKAKVGELLANIGLITSATISNGHVTGYLDSVSINANDITAGTLTTERLIIKGSDKSIIYEMNKGIDGLASTEIPTDQLNGGIIQEKTITADHIVAGSITGTEIAGGTITGDKILSNTITADHISATNLESISAVIGDFDINKALYTNEHTAYNTDVPGVYIGSDYISVGSGGRSWLKYDGSVSLGNGAISYDAIENKVNITADSIKMGTNSLATSDDVSKAQDAADMANSAIGDADTENTLTHRVMSTESSIQLLSDAIRSLVVDSEGGTLLEQTSGGWSFNLFEVSNTLNQAAETLEETQNDLSDLQNKNVELNGLIDDLNNKTAYINITTDDANKPVIELGKTDSDFRIRITNESIDFMEEDSKIAYINNNTLYIERATLKSELEIGENSGFIWSRRENGNMGLQWVGGDV